MSALIVLLGLLGAWELGCRAASTDPVILPAPSDIATAGWDDRGLLAHALRITGGEILLGLAVAVVIGLALALLLHRSTAARRGLFPLLLGSQAIPVPVLGPLLLVWLGFGLAPKVAIVALVCFFPVVVTVLDALRTADPARAKLLQTLRAPPGRALWLVELPGALPALVTGTRLAISVAAVGAFLAESSGSDAGLGFLIVQAIPQLETARAFAAVVVLSAFCGALYAVLGLLQRRVLGWVPRSDARGWRA